MGRSNVSTASASVRNSSNPQPRARNRTSSAACPRFGSNAGLGVASDRCRLPPVDVACVTRDPVPACRAGRQAPTTAHVVRAAIDGTLMRRPVRLSSGQLLQILALVGRLVKLDLDLTGPASRARVLRHWLV